MIASCIFVSEAVFSFFFVWRSEKKKRDGNQFGRSTDASAPTSIVSFCGSAVCRRRRPRRAGAQQFVVEHHHVPALCAIWHGCWHLGGTALTPSPPVNIAPTRTRRMPDSALPRRRWSDLFAITSLAGCVVALCLRVYQLEQRVEQLEEEPLYRPLVDARKGDEAAPGEAATDEAAPEPTDEAAPEQETPTDEAALEEAPTDESETDEEAPPKSESQGAVPESSDE